MKNKVMKRVMMNGDLSGGAAAEESESSFPTLEQSSPSLPPWHILEKSPGGYLP